MSIDDDLAKLDRMVADKNMNWPQIGDGEGAEGPIPSAYHLTGTPTLWLLDASGRIVTKSNSIEPLEAELELLIGD